jgi:hypothetical protein
MRSFLQYKKLWHCTTESNLARLDIFAANWTSPLMSWAVYQCDEVSTQILLKMDANPDAVDRDGLTTLHWAAHWE